MKINVTRYAYSSNAPLVNGKRAINFSIEVNGEEMFNAKSWEQATKDFEDTIIKFADLHVHEQDVKIYGEYFL